MPVGDIFRLTSWTDVAPGVRMTYGVDDRGKVAVMIYLGNEPKDGSNQLDIDEALKRLGYRRTDMNLPPVDEVAAKVHEAWMDAKRAQGITSRKSETGEELMRPFEELSPEAQKLDVATVNAVYDAIEELMED